MHTQKLDPVRHRLHACKVTCYYCHLYPNSTLIMTQKYFLVKKPVHILDGLLIIFHLDQPVFLFVWFCFVLF